MFDLAVLLDLFDDFASGIDRDGEADANVAVAAAASLNLGVDPDHFSSGINQGTARIAWVDRRVGLDHVRDREAIGGLDLALQGGDDASGDGPVEAEGVADRHHGVADLDLGGIAERKRIFLAG